MRMRSDKCILCFRIDIVAKWSCGTETSKGGLVSQGGGGDSHSEASLSQSEASIAPSDQSEMDGSLKLIILCGVMLFGSYLAGSIPLFIAFSEEKLQVRVLYY